MGGTPAPRPAVRGRARAPARRTWPRRWRRRPACRSCSCRRRRSSPCTTARRPARSGPTSGAAQGGARRGRGDRLHRGDRRHRHGRGGGRLRRRHRSPAPVRCDRASLLRRPRRPAESSPGSATAARATVDRVVISEGDRRRRQRAARADAVVRRADRRAEVPGLVVDARQPAAARRTASCRGPCRRRERAAHRRDQPRRQRSTRRCCAPAASTAGSPSSPPGKAGRRELVDHFLARKAHEPELDDAERRDALAAITQGYTPVMIEHLLDEALVNALRRGAPDDDVAGRRAGPAGRSRSASASRSAYTAHEERLIATHEAGHATVAWLVAPQRRLEVLTIVKRRRRARACWRTATRRTSTPARAREMLDLIQIAMGGQVAEELFFGDVSTGPGGDLLYATNVAAQMVGAAGMTDTLVSFARRRRASAFSRHQPRRPGAGRPARAGPRVEELLQRAEGRGPRRCSTAQPAPGRGPARRADGAARARRPGDHRRARAGRRSRPWDGGRRGHRVASRP